MSFVQYTIWIYVVFALSIALSLFFAFVKIKGKKRNISFNILFAGTFITGFMVFYPISISVSPAGADVVQYIKTILVSLHSAIGLFVIALEFTSVRDFVATVPGVAAVYFSAIAAAVYVLSPILTFGVILSFFKNVSAYIKYAFSFFREIYVFSEMNQNSIALAKSIKEYNKKAVICFNDVFAKNEEKEYENISSVKEINAICFKNDILSVKFNVNIFMKRLIFFVVNESESENLKKAFGLVERYGKNSKATLYVFSPNREGEMILNSLADNIAMKVLRINPIRSLTYDLISGKKGYEIFEKAVEKDGEKLISAVVIGMGEHGFEMAKALPWLCQMNGYKFVMNCFDADIKADKKFESRCPGFMDPRYNCREIEGESRYYISVHPGIDYSSSEFDNIIDSIGDVTYVYISLGSDSRNTDAAIKVKTLLNRKGIFPAIKAVIYDEDMNKALNYDSEDDLEFIADLKTLFSHKIIIGSEIEEAGLRRHQMYDKSEDAAKNFWNNEYNYRSSVSSAIHLEIRKMCNVPGAKKAPENRTAEEKYALANLEHRRWNAYMRSEGYVLGEKKNHFIKTHTDLIPFDDLSEEKKNYDDV